MSISVPSCELGGLPDRHFHPSMVVSSKLSKWEKGSLLRCPTRRNPSLHIDGPDTLFMVGCSLLLAGRGTYIVSVAEAFARPTHPYPHMFASVCRDEGPCAVGRISCNFRVSLAVFRVSRFLIIVCCCPGSEGPSQPASASSKCLRKLKPGGVQCCLVTGVFINSKY